MEQKHKQKMKFIFLFVFLITYALKIDFLPIAESSISVISIALAMYTISINGLIGKKFSVMLQKTIHPEKQDCTELDVIRNYFKLAIKIAIITIILSMVIKLDFIKRFSKIYRIRIFKAILCLTVQQVYSSVCFAVLSLNFIFIWLIAKFIINRQVENR